MLFTCDTNFYEHMTVRIDCWCSKKKNYLNFFAPGSTEEKLIKDKYYSYPSFSPVENTFIKIGTIKVTK